MKSKVDTRRLAESGILLAAALVLSMIKIRVSFLNGSITLASMLPIVVLAYKYGPSWGALCGLVHGILQVIEGGGFAPPAKNVWSYILVFILDYALAWALVGFIAGLLRGASSKPQVSIAVGAFVGIAGRFLCSFISGVVIWSVYAPEGQSVWLYSLGVNGAVMVPEMIITSLAGLALFCSPMLQNRIRATAA